MSNKLLEPLNDRVIAKPIEMEEKQYGNIIVPDTGKEKAEVGEVIAVGPGRVSEFGTTIHCNCEVGDKILYKKIGTISIDFDGEEYHVIQDREILARVK